MQDKETPGSCHGWEGIKETQLLSTIEGPGLDPATKQDVREEFAGDP